MLTLAITSATAQTAVALVDDGTLLAGFTCGSDRRHAEVLTPAISFCCEHAERCLGDVELVAVDVGPGLYTGLRVGLATARAVAHVFDVPLVGVSSLEAQADAHRATVSPDAASEIVSVVDARRAEVFWAAYRCGLASAPSTSGGSLVQLVEAQVASPAQLAEQLAEQLAPPASGSRIVVGEGLRRCRDELAGVAGLTFGSDAGPTALAVARLAGREFAMRGRDDLAESSSVRPIYLRTPDAKINFEVRGATAS